MSLRHLSRLKQQQVDGGEAEAEDLSEEEEEEMPSASNFHQLLDSCEDEEEDSEEEEEQEEEEPEEVVVHKKPKAPPTKAGGGQLKDNKGRKGVPSSSHIDDWEEEVYGNQRGGEEGKSQGGGGDTSTAAAVAQEQTAASSWLRIDGRALNVENEIKSRFGAVMAGDGGANNNRRQGTGRRGIAPRSRGPGVALGQLYLRKCMLGAPKEDWARTPTFVGGGLKLVKTDPPEDCQDQQERSCEWYRYEHSPAYQQLQRDFEVVQSTHDPNALAVFLAHHPYHVDGLLTLAMLFAHTGQLDRAAEYVRRCIFVLESGYCESYRPAEGGVAYRMDIRQSENRTYFMSLFRHIQMVGARGLYRTALEVAKLLLSLDPMGDPTGILLAIDYLALRAGKADSLLALRDSGLRIGAAVKDESQRDDGGQASTGDKDDDDEKDGDDDKSGSSSHEVTVAALPNICYSCALAYLQNGKKREAVKALGEAIRRFPLVLPMIVARCRNDMGSKVTQPWDSVVLRHGFFSGASSRVPSGHVLHHLATIYVVRSCDLWKAEESLDLLFEAAVETTRQLDTQGWSYEDEEKELSTSYATGSSVDKYLAASPADFTDEFESLPGDINPLDPALMDPAIARRGRLRILQPGVQAEFQRRRELIMMQGRGGGMRESSQYLLNPDLPLMELFWRTLLPWNGIDTRRRQGGGGMGW